MAPARRKGGGRNSAATAAARREWKVGDLVLAKVKGFPAWPATVSEPQKWGFSTDWKKVLVHFFGTEQIAFCNPADVEAFTEEKKNTLLNKRHGKGADFVRAVDEIIDSYEKTKKEDQVDLHSGDEVAISNSENSENFPMPTHISKSQTVYASMDHTDSCSGNGVSMVPLEGLVSHNTEIVSKDAFESACVLDQLSQTPMTDISFKKRSKIIPVVNGASQMVAASVRRSRSSSRADLYKHHQIHESNLVSDGFSDYKLKKESLHTSDCPDLDLLAHSAIVSSNACGDNELFKAEIESDAVSVNINGTVNSGYIDGHHGLRWCSENGDLMSRKEDSEVLAVVVKRKRKQCRKLATDDMAASTISDKERCLQNGGNKNISSSSSVCENFSDRMQKVDGDEHLPLVKRARARLGKPELCNLSENIVDKEPVKESLVKRLETGSLSSSIDDASHAHKDELGSMVGMNRSPSETSFHFVENNSTLGNTKKFSFKDHTLHSESALPPSKRLHRALEAMNANVAEGAGHAEILEDTKPSLDNRRASSGRSMLSPCEVQDVHLSNNGKSCADASGTLATPPIPQEQGNGTFSEATAAEELVKLRSPWDECCKDKLIDVNIFSDVKDYEDPTTDSQIVLMNMCVNKEILERNRASSDVVSTVRGDCSKEDRLDTDCQCREPIGSDVESVAIHNSDGNLCLVSDADDNLSIGNENPLLSNSSKGVKCLRFQSDENPKFSDKHELEKDVTGILTSKHSDISPCTTQRETSEVKQPNSPAFASRSTDCKVVSDAMSSQPQFHGVDFSERVSSSCPSSSGTRRHITDQNKKSFTLGKDEVNFEPLLSHNQNSLEPLGCQGEAHSLWRLFEAVVRSVSRTKESIARATHLALDCAKYGMCGEVVEYLLKNLENESNLHRRIDLFFLVDSITQCSRGQKGIMGDTYSAAVEAVLPRLVSAAAPPGNACRENRRQCLKVLRLWLERKTLPESIVRHQMRDLESCTETPCTSYSVCPTRMERAINDPLREVEGMLVDEYGSNTSFQLPGFTMPQMLEDDEDEYHDGEQIFEAVTPERDPGISHAEQWKGPTVATEKHRHILEEVDGELEMEDVAPTCDAGVNTECSSLLFVPPLPEELPPSPPPLPVSPPPAAPSVSPPHCTQQPAILPPSSEPGDSHIYDNSQSIKNHLPRQPSSSGINAVFPESLHRRVLGHVDIHIRASTTLPSRSYGSFRGPDSSMHPVNNNGKKIGTGILPNKPYHIRPPPPTLSNQFSYTHLDTEQRSHSRNFPPALVHQRTNFAPDTRESHPFSHRNRMNMAEHGIDERCRYPLPAELGPRHHEKVEEFYPPFSNRPAPSEPSPVSDYGWSVAHRPLNHRYHALVSRPPNENSSSRGPHFWRAR